MKTQTDTRLILLHPDDNVLILGSTIQKDENIVIEGHDVVAQQTIGMGHKLARRPIQKNQKILKYGAPIGVTSDNIELGEHVHLHNLVSNYTPTYSLEEQAMS